MAEGKREKIKKHWLGVKGNIKPILTVKQSAWNARKHWMIQVDSNRRIQNMSGLLKGNFQGSFAKLSWGPCPAIILEAFKVQLKLRQLSIVVKPAFKVKLKCVPSIPSVLSWASYLPAVNLSFIICKMEILVIIGPTTQSDCEELQARHREHSASY